jgi:NADH-quinone oxidoreductase subunit N
MGSYDALIPLVCIVLAALASMGAEAFRTPGTRLPIGSLGVVGLLGAALSSFLLWGRNETSLGVLLADDFSLFVTFVLVAIGILTILFSSQVIDRDGIPAGEYYALLLFSIAGMVMIAMAADLLVIFIALEVLSLAVYVLTGIRRDSPQGSEAAFKYFLLGAFSSAFFLYGIAFAFGLTGTTQLTGVAAGLTSPAAAESGLVVVAIALLLVGFAFKISAVPFHMWTPDAYEGAPAVVTGFMSTAVKAAAFAAFARVFMVVLEPFSVDWVGPVWVIAMATMILGTVVGVAQRNLKRMLAYSSIAHGGYLLAGLIAANEVGQGAILFYLAAYAVTNVAAFGVIALLGTKDNPRDELTDYKGLWYSRPALAALMTVCLLSLGGLPPTAGFIGKWYIFSAAVSEGYYGLAIVGMLTSVVSVFFYLRVVVMMYMQEREETDAVPAPITGAGLAAVAIAVAAIFYLGILPTRVLDLAAASVAAIF